jgi:hypothetical protein
MLSILLKFTLVSNSALGLRVPAWCVRDFTLLSACSSCNNCPFAGCASAANGACRDVDILAARNVLLNYLL